jgi:hypothetical protein
MVYITVPAFLLRRSLGNFLDLVLQGKALILTRNGRRIGILLPPDATPEDMAGIQASTGASGNTRTAEGQ